MNSVGIRELRAHLSRHLKRVRSGARLVITERGRAIASIQPIETRSELGWAYAFVAEGQAYWSGGKPQGSKRPAAIKEGGTVADAVLKFR